MDQESVSNCPCPPHSTIQPIKSSLPTRDRRHLEAFAQKHRGALCAELRAAQFHEEWRREHERREAAKREREEALRAALEEKRRREGEDGEARLEGARLRFRESQRRLKDLIREKEEKRTSLKRERERYARQSICSGKFHF